MMKEGTSQGDLESKNGYKKTRPSLCNNNEHIQRPYQNYLQTRHPWGMDNVSAWPYERRVFPTISSILLMAMVAIFSPFLEAVSVYPANVDKFSSNALSFDHIPANTLDPVCFERNQMNGAEMVGSYLGPFLTNSSMSICVFSVIHKVPTIYSTLLQPSLNSNTSW